MKQNKSYKQLYLNARKMMLSCNDNEEDGFKSELFDNRMQISLLFGLSIILQVSN